MAMRNAESALTHWQAQLRNHQRSSPNFLLWLTRVQSWIWTFHFCLRYFFCFTASKVRIIWRGTIKEGVVACRSTYLEGLSKTMKATNWNVGPHNNATPLWRGGRPWNCTVALGQITASVEPGRSSGVTKYSGVSEETWDRGRKRRFLNSISLQAVRGSANRSHQTIKPSDIWMQRIYLFCSLQKQESWKLGIKNQYHSNQMLSQRVTCFAQRGQTKLRHFVCTLQSAGSPRPPPLTCCKANGDESTAPSDHKISSTSPSWFIPVIFQRMLANVTTTSSVSHWTD